MKEEIRTETGRRIQASVDFIHDDRGRQGLGALVTLRDLESMEEIESELELSRRMAAIGRLTSGVAHEVKNPINAIVVHLELLRNKLGDANAPGIRHLEVIDAEIRRLDRVVQTLVDFSRPVELQLREQDLRARHRRRAGPGHRRTVHAQCHAGQQPAVEAGHGQRRCRPAEAGGLNVIQNGAQAMPDGGRLEVTLEIDRKTAVIRIADEGVGHPRWKSATASSISTSPPRASGSGIGLAMTYRILQLHHGSIEVQSRQTRGTEFRLRIPLIATDWGRRHLQPAGVEETKGIGE